MKNIYIGHFFLMNDNNENMFMLIFSTKTREICYYVQSICTNCIRYINKMYKELTSLHFSNDSNWFLKTKMIISST